MNAPWYKSCLQEIDAKIATGRKELNEWESEFLKTVRSRIENNLGLSPKQEDAFQKLHARFTESRKLKW